MPRQINSLTFANHARESVVFFYIDFIKKKSGFCLSFISNDQTLLYPPDFIIPRVEDCSIIFEDPRSSHVLSPKTFNILLSCLPTGRQVPPIRPRPRIAIPDTPFRELCAKIPYFCTTISGTLQLTMIYANRNVSHGAVKTLTGNNPWQNSGKARVQHTRSKGRAVLSFLGYSRSGPDFH
jgi:hypothetical protein